MSNHTYKSVVRSIRKLQEIVNSRFARVEVFEAKDRCSKKEKIKEVSLRFTSKSGWLYIIAPYKYVPILDLNKI